MDRQTDRMDGQTCEHRQTNRRQTERQGERGIRFRGGRLKAQPQIKSSVTNSERITGLKLFYDPGRREEEE